MPAPPAKGSMNAPGSLTTGGGGCGGWGRADPRFPRAARLDGAAEGLRGVDRGDPSPMDDGDAVAELVRLLEVVRGEEHRGAGLAVEAPDRVPDEAGAPRGEAGAAAA